MLRPAGKLCGILLLAGCSVACAQQYTISTAAGGAPATPAAATALPSASRGGSPPTAPATCISAAATACSRSCSGGTLTLVAGNSRAGFSGDGGPAVNAQLNTPQGLAVDPAGNLYIADSMNNRVRMVTRRASSTLSRAPARCSPGGGPSTSTMAARRPTRLLHLPHGVAVDSIGNVYIADTGDNIIRKVTTDGIINTIAATATPAIWATPALAINAELHTPDDVAVDSTGNIYIADTANALHPQGHHRRQYQLHRRHRGLGSSHAGIHGAGDGGPATSAALVTPYALAVDSSGTCTSWTTAIAASARSIPRATSTRSPATALRLHRRRRRGHQRGIEFPTGVPLDSSGNIYIADSPEPPHPQGLRTATSAPWRATAMFSYSGDGGLATNAQLNAPQAGGGARMSRRRHLYIADTAQQRGRGKVARIERHHRHLRRQRHAGIGGDGGAATSAQLNAPQGHGGGFHRQSFTSPTRRTRACARSPAAAHQHRRGQRHAGLTAAMAPRPPARN